MGTVNVSNIAPKDVALVFVQQGFCPYILKQLVFLRCRNSNDYLYHGSYPKTLKWRNVAI